MLSHPLVIETKAVTPLEASLTGLISPYVSSLESNTLTAFLPSFTSSKRFGMSLYASGPTTKSTIFSSSRNLDFNLSAIHPKTPTFKLLLFLFSLLKLSSLFLTVVSAFSLIEHVFNNIKSASFKLVVESYPSLLIIEATTSLSAKFI